MLWSLTGGCSASWTPGNAWAIEEERLQWRLGDGALRVLAASGTFRKWKRVDGIKEWGAGAGWEEGSLLNSLKYQAEN